MFKAGDVVMVDPEYNGEKGDFGIFQWRKYIGEQFTILYKAGFIFNKFEVYAIKENDFVWSEFMLVPVKNTIKELLKKRNET